MEQWFHLPQFAMNVQTSCAFQDLSLFHHSVDLVMRRAAAREKVRFNRQRYNTKDLQQLQSSCYYALLWLITAAISLIHQMYMETIVTVVSLMACAYVYHLLFYLYIMNLSSNLLV